MTEVEATSAIDEDVEYPPASGFGEGDLGRVRALLFGDHALQTMDRIDSLEQALLGAISDLRSDMEARLAELERRIDAESENRTKAVSNLGSRLTEEAKTLSKADRALERDLAKTADKLTTALDRSQATLSEKIESVNSTLRESNVDRGALAGMMAAVAEQLAQEKS